MKCPKCDYLGFETGDRCKHCGYDFSLLPLAPSSRSPSEDEISLRPPPGEASSVSDAWLKGAADEIGAGPLASAAGRVERSFPLFPPAHEGDNAPLVKLPAEPRAPLAVRRTPDLRRFRSAPKAKRRDDERLALEFAPEAPVVAPDPPLVSERPVRSASARAPRAESAPVVASLHRRAIAALTDHAILFGVDLAVVYCTLRMASLAMSDWRVVPLVPLLTFLGLLKLTYFAAFTALGGQTIGKMVAGIRVVADDHLRLDAGRAIGRTLAEVVSLAPLGLGLVPALLGPDRRALHDRVAHTRVVDRPSA